MNSKKRFLSTGSRPLLSLPVIVSLLAAVSGVAGDSASPAKTTPAEASVAASPLSPIAFLASGKWEAKLPAKPDGSRDSIVAQFTWADNHRAIRISNAFVLSGKPMPYIDGMYVWHPQKRAIVFWYVDAKGSLTEGTVREEKGALLHEFQETDPSGEVQQFSARVTQDGPDAWENEISARKEGHLAPIIKVRYEKVK
ncbi:exported hypothetical protein [Verrucomicrobia bacterium]|nr:exported hypothetical protein [Verrucomicrobiota bacterium]